MSTAIPPSPLAPPPPPLPLAMPSSSINENSVADGKWKVRTESKCGEIAQGSIEIPERQSVASLCKQIANKLDATKKPNVSDQEQKIKNNQFENETLLLPRSKSTTNVSSINNDDDRSNRKLFNNQRNRSSTIASSINHQQQQQPVIHGPVKRHLSCITPVPYCKNAILKSTINTTNTNHSLTQQISYKPIHYSTMNRCEKKLFNNHSINKTNDFLENNKNDRNQIFEKLNNNYQTSIDINESITHSEQAYNNGSDSAIDLTPPVRNTIINNNFDDQIKQQMISSNDNDISCNPTNFNDKYTSTNTKTNSINNQISDQQSMLLDERFEMASSGRSAFMLQCAGNNAHLESAKRDSSPNNFDHCLPKYLSNSSRSSLLDAKSQRSSIENVKSTNHFQLETPNSQWYRNMFKMMHKIDYPSEFFFLTLLLSYFAIISLLYL